jgi:hypothetical protein
MLDSINNIVTFQSLRRKSFVFVDHLILDELNTQNMSVLFLKPKIFKNS